MLTGNQAPCQGVASRARHVVEGEVQLPEHRAALDTRTNLSGARVAEFIPLELQGAQRGAELQGVADVGSVLETVPPQVQVPHAQIAAAGQHTEQDPSALIRHVVVAEMQCRERVVAIRLQR